MKKYVFITHSVKNVGGVQCYVAAKAKYLEEQGWDVKMIFSARRPAKYKCPIPYFEKYLSGNILWAGIAPFKMPHWLVYKTLNRMLSVIGKVDPNEENIVETHDDTYSMWGEMIATRIGARHYTYLMNEYYRYPNQCYEAKIDFFKFKFARHEILGCALTFNKLFDGYMTVTEDDYPGDAYIDESPIQDIHSDKVSSLLKQDWNICYIGRSNKPYVPFILSDVGRFAYAHPDKNIQLIIVSTPGAHHELISLIKKDNDNLKVIEMGLLHPIPRALYSKVDVVIAGSGSGRHSCDEGAVVIIPDPETNKSNGLLGYDTMSSIFRDENSVVTDFFEALERVLVRKEHIGLVNKWSKSKGVAYSVQHSFNLFNQSERKMEYYDEDKLLSGPVNYRSMLTTWLVNNFPSFTQCLVLILGMNKSKIK